MGPGFLTLWPMALRRLKARWKLLLPLLVGSILAVALLSSTVIYGDGVRQLGLEFAFRQETRDELDVDLFSYYNPTELSAFLTIQNEVERAIDRNVDWFVDDTSVTMRGSTFFVNQVARGTERIEPTDEVLLGVAASQVNPRLRTVFLAQDQFNDKTSLVSGRIPPTVTVQRDANGLPTSSPELPALILEETALQHGLSVGDRILMVPYWEAVSEFGVARVAGIVRPNDPSDRFWLTTVAQQTARSRAQNFIPMYVSQDTFLGGLGGIFPRMLSDYSWSLFVDPSLIDVQNAGLAEFGLERMENQLRTRLRSFIPTTELDVNLEDFSTRDLFGRIPLLIMVMMIVGIIFYFLVMVANVVVSRDLGEISLLGSRGADTVQVLTLYLWEAASIVAVALAVGPFLAMLATSVLGYTPAFSDLSGGSALPADLTVQAVLLGLAGAGIAFAALLLPTVQGLGQNVLQYKAASARPLAASFFNRYYIDIFVSIIAGLLYWELTQRGSVVTTTLLGETSVDQALLAAPALILLAVALLFLRFFPMVARAASWFAALFGKAWLALGMWQMGRNPLQYTGPILLLMLASSVAMFAANFGATVDRSYEDRALYATGGEFRVPGGDLRRRGDSVSYMEQNGDVEGADRISPALRERASMALRLFNSRRFQLLAIEPSSFDETAWFRGDFSSQSLDELTNLLEPDTPTGLHGLTLPEDATMLGVWTLATNPRRDLVLLTRVADSNGRYEDFTMGTLDSPDWKYLEVDLTGGGASNPRFRGLRLQPPLRVVSLTIEQRRGNALSPGAVYLDDLQAGPPSSDQRVILHTFDDISSEEVLHDSQQSISDSLEISTSVVREEGDSSGVFIWGSGSIFTTRGFSFLNSSGLQTPLAGIVSRSLMEAEGLSRGDEILVSVAQHVTPVRIDAVADFFPTLDPFNGGFVVVNLPALLERLNTLDTDFEHQPNELWVDGPPDGPARVNLLETLSEDENRLVDRLDLLSSFRADPLVAAGWDGILTIAFIAVVFVTLVGFSVYSYVQGQRRRTEFAMLRSIGLSFPGLVSTILLEQIVVIVVGLALGSWLGIQLTTILMPFLGLNESGTQVLPPFAVRIDWPSILITYGIMAVVFLVATVGLIAFFSRMAIQQALRFGDTS